MKKLTLVFLLLFSVNAFSCSNKDQLTITINTTAKANFPHKEYVSLGKKLFNDDSLASQLHSYSASIDHSSATLVFDLESSKIKNQLLTKMSKILDKQNLRAIRVTHDKLQ